MGLIEKYSSRKHVFLSVLIFLLCILFSCKESPSTLRYTRIISNTLDQDFTLTAYSTDQVIETIFIESGKSDTVDARCTGDGRGFLKNCELSWADISADSVIIEFEDQKKLTYYFCEELPCMWNCNDLPEKCFTNGKNILYLSGQGGYEFMQGRVFLFRITEEDYNESI